MYMCGCVHVCMSECIQFICSFCDLWQFIISGLEGCFQMPTFTVNKCDHLATIPSSFYCLLYARDAYCITDKQLVLDSNKTAD